MVLGTIQLSDVGAGRWHNLKLRSEGSRINALVDGKSVLAATDNLYDHGMAGLLTGQDKRRNSAPWFDNLLINAVNGPLPKPSSAAKGQSPICKASSLPK